MKEKKNIRSIRDIVASMLGRRKDCDVVRVSARNAFVPRYVERYSGIPLKDTMKRILLGEAVGMPWDIRYNFWRERRCRRIR